ncbi:MAG: GNAT family N-acetyltransferase, partial [Gemmatimonadaceae bacterium]
MTMPSATMSSATRPRNPTQSPPLRPATTADLPAAERLLADSGLPTTDTAERFAARAADFVVADDPQSPGELAAVGGIEVCAENALLRSVAVRPEWR